MSILLTDKAVRINADSIWPLDDLSTDTARDELLRDARAGLTAVLHHHATEGREALVEAVVDALRDPPYDGPLGVWERTRAEAVVTALVGPDNQRGT